ncbi:hypothetical protein ACEUZ9_000756 [Paracoccus litorisediminis]|uniref:hypothetical protein n=1 Tax=Paracoccus litorisediminis TaxID=2006130 RepID=UPI00372E19DF
MKRIIEMIAIGAIASLAIVAPAMAEATDQQLIVKWKQADNACRGTGPSRKAYPEACGVRAERAAELNTRGWCHAGRIDMWAPCAAIKRD